MPKPFEGTTRLDIRDSKAGRRADKINDLSVLEFIKLEYDVELPPSGRFVGDSGATEVPEASIASAHRRSFKIFAEVEFTRGSKGVICAQGSRFDGYSLFVKEGSIHFVYNFPGMPPEQQLTGPAPTSGKHVIGVEFAQDASGESPGTMKLYVDDKAVAQNQFRNVIKFVFDLADGPVRAEDNWPKKIDRPRFTAQL